MNSQKIAVYYRAKGRILTRQEHNVSQGNNQEYQHRPAGRRLHYSYDGMGSVASLSKHNGTLRTRYRYDAFGKLTDGDITENPYAFTGKRFDEETGVYKFHFRQYDPMTGVWTTPDPIGILGGMNLYQYARSNPVNLEDPLGLETEGEYSAESYSGSEEDNANGHCEDLGDWGGGEGSLGGYWSEFRDRISILNQIDNFLSEIDEVIGSFSRAFNPNAISHYSQRAFSTELDDPYAHERAAYDYGAYVANPYVAGGARTLGEVVQFGSYGIETAFPSIDILPGAYNPFSREYLEDSIQDIRNVIDGANGSTPDCYLDQDISDWRD